MKKDLTSIGKEELIKDFFSLPYTKYGKEEVVSHFTGQGSYFTLGYKHLITNYDYIRSLFNLYPMIPLDLNNYAFFAYCLLAGVDNPICSCGKLKWRDTRKIGKTCGDMECTSSYKKLVISNYDNHLEPHYLRTREEALTILSVQFKDYLNYSPISPQYKEKRLDLYFPIQCIGIEFNDNYSNSDETITEKYHQDKVRELDSIGVKVISIFQHQFTPEKKEIWKSLINSKLNSLSYKVYARNCEIKEVSSSDSREFLIKNHLQGECTSSAQLGLYHSNELISLMTFGKSRFSKDAEYELLRFCSKLNYSVVGGASKLLKNFIKLRSPRSIISYANLQWSDGNLYRKLGFALKSISEPNYWWIKNERILSRYQCQKHKLNKLLEDNFDANLSESGNMKKNGFHKVNDCGNLVFILILSSSDSVIKTTSCKTLELQTTDCSIPLENKETSRKVKKIICFETKEIFYSILEAVRVKGADESSLYKALDKPSRTSGGYHWCTDLTNFEGVELATKSGPKKILCVETSTEFESISKASNLTGITKRSILRCLDNPSFTAGGYHWVSVQ